MDSVLDIGFFFKVSIFIVHESSILHWNLVSVLVLIVFIKRNIAFSNFNVTCVKKKYLKLVYLKKKVRLLEKKLRQKQKALKEKKKNAFTQTESWNTGACSGAEC